MDATIVFPQLQLIISTSDGAGELTFPQLQVTGSGKTGNVGSGAITFPQLQISGWGDTSASGAITFPQITLTAVGSTSGLGVGALTFPQLQVYGVGESAALETFEAWVVNLRTGGHWNYDNYPVTAVLQSGGEYYGVIDGDIYLLSGDTDAGEAIEASTLSGAIDFGESRLKTVDSLYLNVRKRTGDVSALATVDETLAREREISLVVSPEGMHRRRAKFGEGLYGSNWQFGVKNVLGSRVDVGEVEVEATVMSRRTR